MKLVMMKEQVGQRNYVGKISKIYGICKARRLQKESDIH